MTATITPHINSKYRITNRLNTVVPIGAGVRLLPGQVYETTTQFLQKLEELQPALQALQEAGHITYEFLGESDAVPGSQDTLRAGLRGAVTAAATNFIDPDYTESATDDLGVVLTRGGCLRNLWVRAGTAPGGVTTGEIVVYVNGVATGLAVTLTGAAVVGGNDVARVDVSAGDRVSFASVQSAASAMADILIGCELGC